MTHLAEHNPRTDAPLKIFWRIATMGIMTTYARKLPIRITRINRAFEGMALAAEASHRMVFTDHRLMTAQTKIIDRGS